jgi:hypothetical protein
MSLVASREKWSFSDTTVVPGGRFPTQRAWPDCFGFRGGPRGMELTEAERGNPVTVSGALKEAVLSTYLVLDRTMRRT